MLRWYVDGSNVEESQQTLIVLSHSVRIPSEEIGQLTQEYKLFMEIGDTPNYLLLFARS